MNLWNLFRSYLCHVTTSKQCQMFFLFKITKDDTQWSWMKVFSCVTDWRGNREITFKEEDQLIPNLLSVASILQTRPDTNLVICQKTPHCAKLHIVTKFHTYGCNVEADDSSVGFMVHFWSGLKWPAGNNLTDSLLIFPCSLLNILLQSPENPCLSH